ncbi:hypothetical protein F5Y14DRAFT_420037 [Nemania sp. NC0429]|nr:hypothetical protein F5Y14DRAFT_420037 [Nemania sp. NC0429]
MAGFLIPPSYTPVLVTALELNIACVIWGLSLATSLFVAAKAIAQTRRVWKRTKRLNAYIYFVWAVWISSTATGIISWLYLADTIPPSFHFYFAIVTLWAVQTQCIMQILVNRVSLINPNISTVKKIRWTVFVAILLINVSVYIIWMPARLQISPVWIHLNEVYDRLEKVFFLIIDASLSSYFAYLVRTKLVANGLLKYNRLYRWNVAMIIFSVTLDIILIAVLSIGHGFVYMQYQTLAYLLKLHIELNLTDLLAKIVRVDEAEHRSHGGPSSTGPRSTGNLGTGKNIRMTTLISSNRGGDRHDTLDSELQGGIRKTVETEVRFTAAESSDAGSQTSSTRELHSPFDGN